jgi:DNA-binding transcriptional MerR regulator
MPAFHPDLVKTEDEPTTVDKSPDAFRTISEVADDLDLPQHVLRFWETRFNQIRPMKRGGGRRYYRPDDVELLRGIRHLLYGEGYTIKGVQRILKEQGVRFVMDIWRNPGTPIPNGRSGAAANVRAPAPAPAAAAGRRAEIGYDELDDQARGGDDHATSALHEADEPLPAGIIPDGAPARSGLRRIDRLRGASESGQGGLSKEEIRKLQGTLFELLECKRLLDQTR